MTFWRFHLCLHESHVITMIEKIFNLWDCADDLRSTCLLFSSHRLTEWMEKRSWLLIPSVVCTTDGDGEREEANLTKKRRKGVKFVKEQKRKLLSSTCLWTWLWNISLWDAWSRRISRVCVASFSLSLLKNESGSLFAFFFAQRLLSFFWSVLYG